MNLEALSSMLFDAGVVKFGEFTLKSGLKSPFYIDLRVLISHPEVLKEVAHALVEKTKGVQCDLIAGIPYAAIAIATAISLENGKPMVFARKENKDYGTKKKIEGIYEEGQTVLVYDDLITDGKSKFEAMEPLVAAGLVVKDFAVLVDREQGGEKNLAEKGLKLHTVMKVTDMLSALKSAGKITEEQYTNTMDYFKDPESWQNK